MIPAYADNDMAGRMALSLRDCVPMEDNALPDKGPVAAIVQASSPERRGLAVLLARKRMAVAVLGASDCDCEWLSSLARTAARNHVKALLLGSWRYIPAVAALKETAESGCLGEELSSMAALARKPGPLDAARLEDASLWISGNKWTPMEDAPMLDASMMVAGKLGWARADFSLDGSRACFEASFQGRRIARPIPPACPLQSELAVLALTMRERADAKAGTPGMLMEIPLDLACKLC